MNCLKIIFLMLLLVISIRSVAQEGLILKPLGQDTAQLQIERQIEYRQLISGKAGNDFMMEKIDFPAFDFKTEFSKRYSFNFHDYYLGISPKTGFSWGRQNPFFMPFFQNGMVLSEGAYKMGDKFTFGGFSYGANSIMNLPTLNPAMNNFDSYGSTLFLQYKVSKNFKIETRVNVSQGGKYP